MTPRLDSDLHTPSVLYDFWSRIAQIPQVPALGPIPKATPPIVFLRRPNGTAVRLRYAMIKELSVKFAIKECCQWLSALNRDSYRPWANALS